MMIICLSAFPTGFIPRIIKHSHHQEFHKSHPKLPLDVLLMQRDLLEGEKLHVIVLGARPNELGRNCKQTREGKCMHLTSSENMRKMAFEKACLVTLDDADAPKLGGMRAWQRLCWKITPPAINVPPGLRLGGVDSSSCCCRFSVNFR